MAGTKSDTIIGIVGAVAIVLALVGVFVYEYNNVEDGDGTQSEPPIASETFDGTLGQDETADVQLNPAQGVTSVTISISWTPTAPGPLAPFGGYTYELTDPDGEVVDSGSSTTATTLTVPQPIGGTYTLTLGAPAPGLGGDYVVNASYDY